MFPGVPVETRESPRSAAAFTRLESRLARGEPGAVGALLKDENGAVLLVRHDPATGWPPEAWAVPGGGVRKGETYEAAAAREVAEETGLVATAERALVVVKQVFTHGSHRLEYPFVLFACALPGGARQRVEPRAHEIREARWFKELPPTTFDREMLARFL
ncbi:MAG: NUDIX domain-containing protein [Thermoplasmatota archaeon]